MAETINLTEARQVLKQEFGGRLKATKEDGRRILAQALMDKFGVSSEQALRIVRELEDTHALQWMESGGDTVVPDSTLVGGVFEPEGLNLASEGGLTRAEGFWQL